MLSIKNFNLEVERFLENNYSLLLFHFSINSKNKTKINDRFGFDSKLMLHHYYSASIICCHFLATKLS